MSLDRRVPVADPLRFLPGEETAIRAAIDEILGGGPLVLGEHVAAFESSFAAYLCEGAPPEVIGVGNGSDALVLALAALELPEAGEVLVPVNDGGFGAGAVRASGRRPVTVDVDADTHLVTAETLERAVTPGAAAVVLTHLHGQPVPAGTVDWARARGLRVVEDAAQAHGALLADTRAGTLGDVAAFSFYPTKNLGALGDGGAVVTADAGLAARVRRLRQYGWGERFRVTVAGGRNSRLDAVQAAVLSARLPWLDAHNRRRREVAGRYRSALGAPVLGDAEGGVAHHAVALHPDRDALAAHLDGRGIDTDVHYPWLVGEMSGLEAAGGPAPVADRGRRTKLSLPCFGGIGDDEVDRVCDALESWRGRG